MKRRKLTAEHIIDFWQRNQMRAIIHWTDGEAPTYCPAEVRGPAPKGGTIFKLRFEKRWFRIQANKDGSMWVKPFGAAMDKQPVTFEPASKP